ncbi:TPA: replication initiator protein A [Staphylococcus aureus]|uniref:replication initiator protein A n=1 Tax=Staphylococcus aureus TaxID=1280 RepID=UPI000A9A8493|nr:replication initiator protein A [Staphylococcus aureus]MBK4022635.1 replication initiator protein A [Staphylococcus aureus]MDT3960775.1 replication initiator protein A [Staphylococcus aureus]UNS69747.1 replication initiator protein A [Staphylococcus aureus]HAR7083509.1 replication initiator protein A [Staphylococcus aureus]HBI0697383.1 replication initiator protein A [Staphylococcus aureus]
MSEQRFNIQQQYREKFYQLPKVFFTNEKYMQLSNDAKIAYALLKDRLELSIKNNWFDENGDIFFIFTNDKLKNILNCHDGKLTKIKKELSKADLLEQVRCGQGKPNKLYLKNPAITKEDVYEIKKQEETSGEPSHDAEMRKSHFKKCENRISRNAKIAQQEMRKSHTNDTDLSNTYYIETENNDMNDLNDIESKNEISNHSNHSNQFTHNFDDKDYKEILLQEFPEQLTNYLLKYDYRDLEIIKAVILKAKKSFNSNHDDNFYMLEHIENEILISLKRLKKAIHDRRVKGQKETIKSMQGYLMQTILTELEELHSTDMRRKNLKNSSWNIF